MVQRGPLPRFDTLTYDPDTGAPLPVYTTPNGAIPPRKTPGYIRADLWGVTIPGLPKIPGGASGPAQSRMLSYLLQQYPDASKHQGLDRHARYGYDDFFLSWPDCRTWGYSIADYVTLSTLVKSYGLRVCHFFRSKDHDPANPNPVDVYPVITALLDADVIDLGVHAWEQSLFNSPEHTRQTIDQDAATFPEIRWAIHLQEAYASFGPAGDDQGPVFWKANIRAGVKLLLYQCVATWSAGMMAARCNDVSVRFVAHGNWGLPETVGYVPFELIATRQFNNQPDGDGRLADEQMGNLKAFECLGSPGPVAPSGYGQGCSWPDGTAI